MNKKQKKTLISKLPVSAESFEDIFEQSPVGLLLYDKSGHFLKANRASLEILSVKNDRLLKKHSLFDIPFFPKISRASLKGKKTLFFEILLEKGNFSSKGTPNRNNFLRVHVIPVQNKSKKTICYLINIQDITPLKSNERMLEESERTLHTILSASPVGICLVNRERKLGWANDFLLNMIGYSQSEILGKNAHILYPSKKEYTRVGAELYDKMRKKGLGEIDTVWKKKDGTIFNVHIHVRPIFPEDHSSAVIAGIVDITERIKSEQYLSAIVDQSPISMWILDKNGVIKKINDASLNLFKIKEPESIIDEYNIFRDEILKKQGLLKEIKKVYEQDKIIEMNIRYDFKKAFHSKLSSADPLLIDLTVFPVKDPYGNVSHAIVMHRDITELSRLEQQLRQAHKMEAIGRLAGGVAHDFNNILEIISGHVDLARIADNQESCFESLNIIHQAVKRAADLTAKLLGYAREGKYKSEPVDARSIIEDVYILISQTFDKRIKISLNIAGGYHFVECDKGQIEQSLLNLCLNAKDAMSEGGELYLEAQSKTMDDKFVKAHVGSRKGHYVLISVKDTGSGMGSDIKPHIFEPFFTTKEKSYHSGMGLSMVYGIVKNHGGYIDVQTKVGKGTTFNIYLPILEIQKEKDKHTSRKKKVKKVTGTILFVDDECLIISLIKKILEANGYTVLTAQDGFEAEKVLKSSFEDIDLIILDLIMPHMSGKEAFIKLHDLKKDIPIILSSGFSLNEDSQEILNMGAFEYLQKPFDLVKLLQTVQDALNQ